MVKIRKAMLFSAGKGERLKPLTNKIPKPMLVIGNRPLLDYQLLYLKRYGVEEVIINIHHLPEIIKKHVGDGSRYGLHITYSYEKALLGTGGGLKKVEPLLEKEKAFFTLNSAALTNCDLNALTKFHFEKGGVVTLVMRPWQEGYTRLTVKEGELKKVGEGNHLFTGLTVMTPAIFSKLELRDSNLVTEGVEALRKEGEKIAAFEHQGYWRKIENEQDYQAVQEEWISSHQTRINN